MIDVRFFTTSEAAEILATNEDKVRSWIHSGELCAVDVAAKPGGKKPRWRIPETALSRFLIGRQRHPKAKPVDKSPPPRARRLKSAPTKNFFPGAN